MSNEQSQKPLTNWIPTPEFEEYRERFSEHFELERREDGVLFACMHTLGGEVQWNAQLHRAIWQLFRTVGSDPKNESWSPPYDRQRRERHWHVAVPEGQQPRPDDRRYNGCLRSASLSIQ